MRSPSELPLLRILHIKTLSAARSMLHSISYGTLSSCGSNGVGYCILKEKMATTTKSWMGPCLEETPRVLPGCSQDTPRILSGYAVLSQGAGRDRQCGDKSWLSKATHTCCAPTQGLQWGQVGVEGREGQAGDGGSGLWSCPV